MKIKVSNLDNPVIQGFLFGGMIKMTKKSLLAKVLEKRGISLKDFKFEKYPNLIENFPELENAIKDTLEELFYDAPADIEIGVHYDVDSDGLFAGYIMEDFLKRMGFTEVHNFINPLKKHGIVEETIEWAIEKNLKWLFVVDSGSTNYDEIRYLTEKGIKVVVLDHHPYTEQELPENAWLVNISKYPNLPDISGCGVTYRFIEGVADAFENMIVDDYEVFVGITAISDMMDMRDSENRYYVRQAFEGRSSTELFRKIPFWGSNMSFYGWQLVPYLNAMIRIGAEKRAVRVVNNMNDRIQMARTEAEIKRIKGLQKDFMSELEQRSKIKENDHVVLCLRIGEDKLRTLNGLVGNQLVSKYGKSALVLAYNKEIDRWSGSFRGFQFTNKELTEWGFECKGHPQACGASISHEGLLKFFKEATFPPYEKPKADIYVDEDEITDHDLLEIAQFNEYTGTGLPKILIGFKNGTDSIEAIDEVGNKNILILNKFEVIDFDQTTEIGVNIDKEDLIVTPTLSLDGYQLFKER